MSQNFADSSGSDIWCDLSCRSAAGGGPRHLRSNLLTHNAASAPAQPRQMAPRLSIVQILMNQIVLWKVAGSISPNYFMTVYWTILILTVNIFVLATPNIFIREEQCDNKLNYASPSNQHHWCSLWHLWESYLWITMLLLLLQCYKYKYYSVFSQIDHKM